MTNTVRFIEIDGTGKQISVRNINRESIAKCPSFILVAAHYRADGSCRHDEKICEELGCKNSKVKEEIYCSEHMAFLGPETGGVYVGL
jgi:hypothetical protein